VRLPVNSALDLHLLLTLFGISAFVLTFALLVVLVRLQRYRTDITGGQAFGDGASPIWQANVMSAANYTEPGRRLLRRCWWLLVAFACSLVGLFAHLGRL
jgi:hypothetical protein